NHDRCDAATLGSPGCDAVARSFAIAAVRIPQPSAVAPLRLSGSLLAARHPRLHSASEPSMPIVRSVSAMACAAVLTSAGTDTFIVSRSAKTTDGSIGYRPN